MDKPSLNLVRAADVAEHLQQFSHPWNPDSEMHGMQLARSVGLKRTGVNFIRVPPGRESYVYHSHRYEEEWIYVLSGRATALNCSGLRKPSERSTSSAAALRSRSPSSTRRERSVSSTLPTPTNAAKSTTL